jgi:hypothetical protein
MSESRASTDRARARPKKEPKRFCLLDPREVPKAQEQTFFVSFFQKRHLAVLYRQSGILIDAAAQEDLTAEITEITEEKATEKSLLPGSTIFSPCLPSVISVISVVKSFLRRRAARPPGRRVLPGRDPQRLARRLQAVER